MELAKKLFSVVSKTILTINDNVTRIERKTNLIDAFAFELLYVDGNTPHFVRDKRTSCCKS